MKKQPVLPSGLTIKYLEILSSISPNMTIVEAKKNMKGVIKAIFSLIKVENRLIIQIYVILKTRYKK
ncbi:hypothetical protein IR152_04450 [Clostridioides sp. ES-S-0108-01]|uniref:hypothetical protein n=1 Tax=Clostridioides sp. ES-S-0108-01 TaxID=2770773 RepID=UPI001D0CB880|nr:hypothetical protein [Clostridioides sp. ES-S-0108-01]